MEGLNWLDCTSKELLNFITAEYRIEIDKFSKLETAILLPNHRVIGKQKIQSLNQNLESIASISISNNVALVSCFKHEHVKPVYSSLVKNTLFDGVNISVKEGNDIILSYPSVTVERKQRLRGVIEEYAVRCRNVIRGIRGEIKKKIDLVKDKDDKRMKINILDLETKKHLNIVDTILATHLKSL